MNHLKRCLGAVLLLSAWTIPAQAQVLSGDRIEATAIAAPATPGAGLGVIYVDSTSKNLAVKDDAGVVKHGVQTEAGAASNFLTAISDAGAVSKAQPSSSNLSDASNIPLLNAANVFSHASGQSTKKVILPGSTSGSMTIVPAAIVGGDFTITLPKGTTDFSSTGGTSQVLKQASAGAAITVGTLASTELSDTTALAYLASANLFTTNQTITKTTEQFRLRYDASNYAGFTVSSTGVLTIATASGAGNDFIALADNLALGDTASPGAKLSITGTTPATTFLLRDSAVAHGMSGWLPNTAYAAFGDVPTKGGMYFIGASSDASTIALQLVGLIGVADPTDSVAAIYLYGGKKDGTGAIQLADAETLFQVTNAGTVKLTMLGSGSTSLVGHFLPSADNTYNLGTAGTMRWKDIFAVTKTSSLDVSWGSKNVLVSVLEGPEYRLYDSGTIVLDALGQATVTLDPHYVEVTNTAMPYQVLASGALVRNKTSMSFVLQGQPNDSIDWMISATRAGFENVRWRDPAIEAKEPLGLYDPWEARHRKVASNNTVLEPARRVSEDLPPFDLSEDGRAVVALRALALAVRVQVSTILGVPIATSAKAQIRDAVHALTPLQCASARTVSGLVLPCRMPSQVPQ